MADAAKNERVAWLREVLERFERPLLRYAASLSCNSDTARDAVQETFLRLCTQDRARLDGHVAEWLFTVCRNQAMDARRKERRMKTALATTDRREMTASADPVSAVEQQDGSNHVLRVLAGLPQNQQEVIQLRFQGGLSYKEIAGVTGLSVTNVGFLLHTAIKTIREQMNPSREL